MSSVIWEYVGDNGHTFIWFFILLVPVHWLMHEMTSIATNGCHTLLLLFHCLSVSIMTLQAELPPTLPSLPETTILHLTLSISTELTDHCVQLPA
jgi:hypothetical protein